MIVHRRHASPLTTGLIAAVVLVGWAVGCWSELPESGSAPVPRQVLLLHGTAALPLASPLLASLFRETSHEIE